MGGTVATGYQPVGIVCERDRDFFGNRRGCVHLVGRPRGAKHKGYLLGAVSLAGAPGAASAGSECLASDRERWGGEKQTAVDLVPGRLRSPSLSDSQFSKSARPGAAGSEIGTGDHTLYWRKKDSWVLTNVAEHLRVVTGSGRAQEIRALKIWRERQRLDFSSFYLELTVIDALWGRRGQGLAENVRRVLQYLADDFPRARVVDPANPHNVISDSYGPEEKRAIAMAARKALGMRRWQQVLW